MIIKHTEEVDRISIRVPDDFHIHFRRGEVLRSVVPYTEQAGFGRALVMPNTVPMPILTAALAIEYHHEICKAADQLQNGRSFKPLMTIQINDNTTSEIVRDAAKCRLVFAGKVYPKGVTTNSCNGVRDFSSLYRVFETMQEVGMVLSLHGQVPEVFCLDRERFFGRILSEIAKDFSGLRIVLEHISCAESVKLVCDLPDTVAATITAHHLLLTLDDILCHVGEGGNEGINPNHYCQPIPRFIEDRNALRRIILSENPKFFFGSDSAPHLPEKKMNDCGCAGIFSAPVALPVLVDFFLSFGFSLEEVARRLERFTSVFGADFYRLSPNTGTISLIRSPWVVPHECGGIVPFQTGKRLNWRVA